MAFTEHVKTIGGAIANIQMDIEDVEEEVSVAREEVRIVEDAVSTVTEDVRKWPSTISKVLFPFLLVVLTLFLQLKQSLSKNRTTVCIVQKDLRGVKENVESILMDVDSVKEKVHVLEFERNSSLLLNILDTKPMPSAYFIGREKELQSLKTILEAYRSAAITGLGGIGKTQLMATFADRAERIGERKRRVFRITADGDASNVIESLASRAEYLHGQKLPKNDRSNPQIVVALLQTALARLDRPWLLCMDNVDGAGDPGVNGVLDATVSLTGNGGWVLITSRTGSSLL